LKKEKEKEKEEKRKNIKLRNERYVYHTVQIWLQEGCHEGVEFF